MSDVSFKIGSKHEKYPLMDALTAAVTVDRIQGFVRSQQGYYDPEQEKHIFDNRTTCIEILRKMHNVYFPDTNTTYISYEQIPVPTECDRKMAETIHGHFDEIIVCAKLTDELVTRDKHGVVNDFNKELSIIFSKDKVNIQKQAAILASLPHSYRLSIHRNKVQEFFDDNRNNGYFGELRTRQKVRSTILDVKPIDRINRTIVTSYTEDKKIIIFFMPCSSAKSHGFKKGASIDFTGYIRTHEVSDFSNCEVTIMNRINIDD